MSALVSLVLKMMISGGKKVESKLEKATMFPDEEQKRFLMDVLNDAKQSEFGQKFDFESIKTVSDFRKAVPITDYDFYSEYIEKMTQGKKNVLTSRDIVHFNETSGTLGVPKLIPVTEQHVKIFQEYNSSYLNYIAAKGCGKEWTKGKGFSLAEGTYTVLPSGITKGCASSLHTARMERMGPWKKKNTTDRKKDTMDMLYTSPMEARKPLPGMSTRYLHARFALAEKNITYGNATFSSYFLEIFRYIEEHWELLCKDIETGTVSQESGLPDNVIKSVSERLVPMPERAQELRTVFSEGFDTPFAKKIWPGLKFFMGVGGAGFQPYTDKLLNRYLGNEVRFLYLGITASEGFFTAPLEIDSPDSVLVPNASFMEFIPVIDGVTDESSGTKLMEELELGRQYELVITNASGLYRYRMKDVIEVTGFHNKTPVVRFVKRSGFAVSMYGEKTSEEALRFTAVKTAEKLGLDLTDYCVCPYMESTPGKYIFMFEFKDYPSDLPKIKVRDAAEEFLSEANVSYGKKVISGLVLPMEVRLLQEQTFLLYRDLMIMKGRSAAQLKPVHVTASPYQQNFFLRLEDRDIGK